VLIPFITLLVTAFVLPPYSCLIFLRTPHRLFGVCLVLVMRIGVQEVIVIMIVVSL
jgi:hypothetical protein